MLRQNVAICVRFTNRSLFRFLVCRMRCEWTRIAPYALLALLSAGSARAQIYQQPIIVAAQPQARGLGGGFIEFLFGERERTVAPSPYALPPQQNGPTIYANTQPSDPM